MDSKRAAPQEVMYFRLPDFWNFNFWCVDWGVVVLVCCMWVGGGGVVCAESLKQRMFNSPKTEIERFIIPAGSRP